MTSKKSKKYTFAENSKKRKMLRIEEASITFGDKTLFSGLNLHLHSGELACIQGESGKGKTSLLNAIMGFVPLSNGRIIVDGIELDRYTIDAIRRHIAWIPQELALPSETVREMVRLPFELKTNRSTVFSERRLFDYFESLGLLNELYTKRVNEISGGQRQRIMIAVAGLLGKKIIVVDEPTSALDEGSAERVLDFFLNRAAEGTTILSVSHDRKFAAGCHRLIELS